MNEVGGEKKSSVLIAVVVVVVLVSAVVTVTVGYSYGMALLFLFFYGLYKLGMNKAAKESADDHPVRPIPAAAKPAAPQPAKKKCPDCAEVILAAAKVCKHCGYRIAPVVPEAT